MPPVPATGGWLPVFLALALGAAACSPPGEGFALDRLAASPPAGVVFGDDARSTLVEVDRERRPAWVSAVDWSWQGVVPPAARLNLGVFAGRPGRAVVRLRDGDRVEVVETLRWQDPRYWQDVEVDLSAHGGRRVRLEFAAELATAGGAEAGAPTAGVPQEPASQAEFLGDDEVAWSRVSLRPAVATATDGRPNLVLIVIDTLRRDRLTSYGYERETSAHIDHWLAQPGVVFERAYAQAPWTRPSMASLLSSRYPSEFLGGPHSVLTTTDEVDLVSQRLQAMGYRTAAFLANPVLDHGSGLLRGLDTVRTSPSMLQPAEVVSRAAAGWLAARGGDPFFLYLHYADPHDPWTPPDLAGGNSPFFPDYAGELTGGAASALPYGGVDLANPPQDVAHLSALYDSEIAYVDRWLGWFFETLPPTLFDNTLFVLTADHGEELLDRQGWGHGRTLYEELVGVPLMLRWDGRLPAGARRAGEVRLLDIAATLVAAAGESPPEHWQGESLLELAAGTDEAPRLAFASNLHAGPRRAMASHAGRKVILFDRHAESAPTDELWRAMIAEDRMRLSSREHYDLERDPAERSPETRPSEAAQRLEGAIHRRLLREMAGLQVLVHRLPVGERVTLEVDLEPPPAAWERYFLEPEDRVEAAPTGLRLEITGGALVKGVILPVEASAVASLRVSDSAGNWPRERWVVSDRLRFAGVATPPQEGAFVELREQAENPLLTRVPAANREQLEKLRNLGYLGP